MLTLTYSLLILLADTWLHVVTETISITRSLRLTEMDSPDILLDSLVPNAVDRARDEQIRNAIQLQQSAKTAGYWSTEFECDLGYWTGTGDMLPCSLELDFYNYTLRDYGEVNQFLSNSSKSFQPQITHFSDSGTDSTMILIVPADMQQSSGSPLDFTAHTYGASTSCEPKIDQCDMRLLANDNLTVNCIGAGSTYQESVVIGNEFSPFENHTLFSDLGYTNPIPWNTPYPRDSMNPSYLPTLNMTNSLYPAVAMASLKYGQENSDTTVQSHLMLLEATSRAWRYFANILYGSRITLSSITLGSSMKLYQQMSKSPI